MSFSFLYSYTYLGTGAFCAAVAFVLAYGLSPDMGTRREIICMKSLLYLYVVFVGLDLLCRLGESGVVAMPESREIALSCADSLVAGIIAYLWTLYAEMRLSARLSGATWFRVALAAPLVVLAVALVVSFTSRSYDYLVERPLAIALYIVFAVVHALVVIVRAKTSSRRSEGALIVGLGIVLLLVAVLNSLATYVPFMVLGMLWSLVMVYVRLQRARIFNDALTGLNNRRRADDYVSQQIARSRRQEKTLMYLMDIDGFKRINDTYGHLEGDRALKAVAGALRRAAGNYDGFAARWGGDEFVLVVPESPALAENPDEVTAFVNSALALLARDEGLPFEVSLTAGHAAIEPSDRRPRDPLRRADAMLYRRKRELHGPATPRLG